jgi:hypothetical protein
VPSLECPFCEKPVGGSNPGTAQYNLERHIQVHHPEQMPEPEFSEDEPPRARPAKKQAAKKQAAPKRAAASGAGIPLSVQLAFPYEILSNLTAQRLPHTSNMLHAQAPVCGQAWDNFLRRFPALREKIESGMIAGDVVALLMAHIPIIQTMRAETVNLQEQMAHYEGGIGNQPAAA